MLNKRGWIKIFEAILAVMLIMSVLIYIYSSKVDKQSYTNSVYNLEQSILNEIANDATLRGLVLNNNLAPLKTFIQSKLTPNLNSSLAICEIDQIDCTPSEPIETKSDVYVEERIISSTLESYQPKIARLFVWEKS